jgi:hypothetical protein
VSVDVLRYAAFTDNPASGNPVGVVMDAGQLTEPDMLGIAAGVGYSETAFVTGADPQRGRYGVRYFGVAALGADRGAAGVQVEVFDVQRQHLARTGGGLVEHPPQGLLPQRHVPGGTAPGRSLAGARHGWR